MLTDKQKQQIHDFAVAEITEAMADIRHKTGDEKIYAFALGLVEYPCGFFCAANTVEALAQSLEEDDDAETEDTLWFWYPSEWKYDGNFADNRVHQTITAISRRIEDDDQIRYTQLRHDYQDCLIAALKTCDERGVFGKERARGELVLYVHYVDIFDEEVDDQSSAILNSAALHQAFVQRWDEDISGSLTATVRAWVDDLYEVYDDEEGGA